MDVKGQIVDNQVKKHITEFVNGRMTRKKAGVSRIFVKEDGKTVKVKCFLLSQNPVVQRFEVFNTDEVLLLAKRDKTISAWLVPTSVIKKALSDNPGPSTIYLKKSVIDDYKIFTEKNSVDHDKIEEKIRELALLFGVPRNKVFVKVEHKTYNVSKKTRKRIVEAAKKLFMDEGYDKVTLKKIAVSSGVSHHTVSRCGKKKIYDEAFF